MSKHTYRRLLWGASLLGTLFFIFAHSLTPAAASAEESGAVFSFLDRLFPFLTHAAVRKLAHFCEYALLGAHMAALPRLWWQSSRGAYPAAILIGVATAFLDEGLQRLVPGRAGLLSDVGIDTAGVLVGFFFFAAVLLLIVKKGGVARA